MKTHTTDTCFVVASDDFGEHPSSLQHLIRYIPEKYPVVWINTIGMRNPKFTLRDLKKIILKSRKMVGSLLQKKGEMEKTGNIQVCQPPMIPCAGFSLVRKINKIMVCSMVKKILNKINAKKVVFIITAPNACDFIGEFGEEKVVYYCVDDFSEWPGLKKSLVKSMQDELIEKSDVLIAASENLSQMLGARGKPVHLLTHGVDLNHFSRELREEHPLLRGIPGPRVGYFGLFDDRNDKKLIEDLACQMPEVSFVITGNVETDVSSLKARGNVYFTGAISYAELPAMARGWDMCMLPYKLNDFTDSIQPLKLKEYLATGKPVLSTPIKEALRLKEYILVGETVQSWEKQIRGHINGGVPEGQSARKNFLQEESWGKKAEKFLGICLESENR